MGIDYVGAEVAQLTARGANAEAIRLIARQTDKMSAEASSRRSAAAQASDLPQVLLGINNSSVAANTSAAVTTQASTTLRITDFFCRDAVGDDFNISAMKMGRLDLVTGGAVPASMFRSSVQRPPLETPALASSTTISMTVDNLTGAAKRFDGGFTGIDLDRQYDVTGTQKCG